MDYVVTHVSSKAWAVLGTPAGILCGFWLSEEFLPSSKEVDEFILRALVQELRMDEASVEIAYEAIARGPRVNPYVVNGVAGRAVLLAEPGEA